MSLPILIAARNEEVLLPSCLAALPKNCEPIVIANGCNDNTAEVARSFGAKVIETAEGKLPAIQEGIKYLGNRALDGFMTLDADSHPLFSSRWIPAMTTQFTEYTTPTLVTGPLVYKGGPGVASNTIRTIKNYGQQVYNRNDLDKRTWSGANMFLRPATTQVLNAVLEMPHLWISEDEAIKDLFLENGGDAKKAIDPRCAVVTDARRHISLFRLLVNGRGAMQAQTRQTYSDAAPPGSVPYLKV